MILRVLGLELPFHNVMLLAGSIDEAGSGDARASVARAPSEYALRQPRMAVGRSRSQVLPERAEVSLHMLTAVDGNVGAGYEGGLLGGQVNDQPGDFLGLAEPADRDVRQDLGV